MDELKPCPFCGNNAVIDHVAPNLFDEREVYGIGCQDCNIGFWSEERKEVINLWNRRIRLPDCQNAEWSGNKCNGYCKSEQDDEPIDTCKACPKHVNHGIE